MSDELLLGFGFVAVIEGLVLCLAPRRIDALLTALREMGPERARALGLAVLAAGVALIWLSQA